MDKYRTKISKSDIHGRGLFSMEEIPRDELILISETIIASGKAQSIIKHVFGVPGRILFPVNKIALINENKETPTCKVIYNKDNDTLELHSLMNIKNGDELTINYSEIIY